MLNPSTNNCKLYPYLLPCIPQINSQNLDLEYLTVVTLFSPFWPELPSRHSIGDSCTRHTLLLQDIKCSLSESLRHLYWSPRWIQPHPESSHKSFVGIKPNTSLKPCFSENKTRVPTHQVSHCILKRFFNFTTSLHSSIFSSSYINQ